MAASRLNEAFLTVLEELTTIMTRQGEAFRAKAYAKAQESILMIGRDITQITDVKGLPGIGATIYEKLKEYCETGRVAVIEAERVNPVNVLCQVHGIGPKGAAELVGMGITTIDGLRANVGRLNATQRIGLQYYDDILQRIPRSEIDAFRRVFVEALSGSARMEIVGSYRRGAETSGDIDLIYTDEKGGRGFGAWLDELLRRGIITHILSRGQQKCLVVARLGNGVHRRVDFLCATEAEYPFAILYFTGSKLFNLAMRHHIRVDCTMTINEHGLCHLIDGGKKGSAVVESATFRSEEDIFSFVGLEYVQPMNRIDGRSVVKCKMDMVDVITAFRTRGLTGLQSCTKSDVIAWIRMAATAYTHGEAIATDAEYDTIRDWLAEWAPTEAVLTEVGAPVVAGRDAVVLPYPMPSMKKVKDDKALQRWTRTFAGPYVVSCKLDGISALFSTEWDGGRPLLRTRGDGLAGENIDHLIPYLHGLPIGMRGLTIRGEIIISRSTFEAHYAGQYAHPRAMMAGCVNNRTDIAVAFRAGHVHFVAYEVIGWLGAGQWIRNTEQFRLLQELHQTTKLHVVDHVVLDKLEVAMLSEFTLNYREKGTYGMDGLILLSATKPAEERSAAAPKHAIAFKMVLTDQLAESVVLEVEWNISKDRYLKPRIRLAPVIIAGAEHKYATGYNAKYIQENGIGVGAVMMFRKGGDVILNPEQVIDRASVIGLPMGIPYIWTDSGVDIIATGGTTEADDSVAEQLILRYVVTLNIEGCKVATIQKIRKAGYKSLADILAMEAKDFLRVEGFAGKSAAKLADEFRLNTVAATQLQLMTASNCFGRGLASDTIEKILRMYPRAIFMNGLTVDNLTCINDIGRVTAVAFMRGIPLFLDWLEDCGLRIGFEGRTVGVEAVRTAADVMEMRHCLYGKHIVCTGPRNKPAMEWIESVGGIIDKGVSGKTQVVITGGGVDTGKLDEARKRGVPVYSWEEFLGRFRNV